MPQHKINGVIRSIVLEPEQIQALERIAKAHDVSVSWLIRKAVELMLTRKQPQTTPQGSED